MRGRQPSRAGGRGARCAVGLGLLVSVVASVLGCASTETGNPPAQPETGLDITRVMFVIVPNMGDPGLLSGAADPTLAAGGTLRITAVETGFETVVAPIGETSAAFSAGLPAGFAGWLRLQVVTADGQRLAPLDVLTSELSLGAVEPLPRALDPCLRLFSDVALEASGEVRLPLRNDCGEVLSFEAPFARLGLVEVVPAGAFDLGVGQQVDLLVSSSSPLGPMDEDVIVLREAGGERRAITVTP